MRRGHVNDARGCTSAVLCYRPLALLGPNSHVENLSNDDYKHFAASVYIYAVQLIVRESRNTKAVVTKLLST